MNLPKFFKKSSFTILPASLDVYSKHNPSWIIHRFEFNLIRFEISGISSKFDSLRLRPNHRRKPLAEQTKARDAKITNLQVLSINTHRLANNDRLMAVGRMVRQSLASLKL